MILLYRYASCQLPILLSANSSRLLNVSIICDQDRVNTIRICKRRTSDERLPYVIIIYVVLYLYIKPWSQLISFLLNLHVSCGGTYTYVHAYYYNVIIISVSRTYCVFSVFWKSRAPRGFYRGSGMKHLKPPLSRTPPIYIIVLILLRTSFREHAVHK